MGKKNSPTTLKGCGAKNYLNISVLLCFERQSNHKSNEAFSNENG